MVPFLFSDFSGVIKNLTTRFVKAEVMSTTLIKIYLGFGMSTALRSENLSQKEMELFRVVYLICLHECVKRILKHSLTFSLTIDLAMKKLSCALDIFVNHNWLSEVQADKISVEFKTVCSLIAMQHGSFSIVSENDIGNAAVERRFSLNKQCLLEISLIAQRTIHDSILSTGGLDDFIITKRFIHAARNAHSKYKEYMEQQTTEEVVTGKRGSQFKKKKSSC
ncbi:hypothetical protein PR048_008578 [Dryococelus australis]|uniref:Uncharacterized protein n=1 Tax=Dryococelus australis TaxID=614101 RepID=A0ABQ9HXI2_9NEOP|nr:hypothetical protein PR048_008578 [Dryococelus australis]